MGWSLVSASGHNHRITWKDISCLQLFCRENACAPFILLVFKTGTDQYRNFHISAGGLLCYSSPIVGWSLNITVTFSPCLPNQGFKSHQLLGKADWHLSAESSNFGAQKARKQLILKAFSHWHLYCLRVLVAAAGLEPATSGLWARRAANCSTPRYRLIRNLRSMVPVTGLEPVRYHYRGILSPLCLPIPPHRRTSACLEYHSPPRLSRTFSKFF